MTVRRSASENDERPFAKELFEAADRLRGSVESTELGRERKLDDVGALVLEKARILYRYWPETLASELALYLNRMAMTKRQVRIFDALD